MQITKALPREAGVTDAAQISFGTVNGKPTACLPSRGRKGEVNYYYLHYDPHTCEVYDCTCPSFLGKSGESEWEGMNVHGEKCKHQRDTKLYLLEKKMEHILRVLEQVDTYLADPLAPYLDEYRKKLASVVRKEVTP